MSSSRNSDDSRDGLVKIVFGIMAIACLVVGLVLSIFSEALGIVQETSRIVAIAFLAAGVGDYLVLRFWDRIAKKR